MTTSSDHPQGHGVRARARRLVRRAAVLGVIAVGMTVQSFATHHPQLFAERTKGVVLVATAAHSLRGPLSSM